jgi:zinc transport system permease protein
VNGFLAALFGAEFPFIRNAFLAGLLSSVLFGCLGSVVTVRRIASLAGAVSHAVLGGIGIALYLSAAQILPGFSPMAGALIFAILSAALIGIVSLKAKQREDTVINAIWAIGMSLGVLFMAKTPGYVDPASYLFGNILLIAGGDLLLLAILGALVLFLSWRFYPQIEASAFDEEFARVRGVSTDVLFLLLLAITAIAIVLLQTFVGIVMVIAMLTLPAGIAGYFARNLKGMIGMSIVFSALFSCGGLVLGWIFDVPVGAVTVILAGAIFLSAAGLRLLKRL